MKRVAIVGLGLMGGSLALALKRVRPSWRLVGCDRPEVLDQARRRFLVDETESRPEKAVRGAEMVVLASPVETIAQHLRSLAAEFESGTLVTDMGSTKRRILEAAASLIENFWTIASHQTP